MTSDVVQPGAPLPPELADADPTVRARYRRVRQLSHVLDSQFTIPGTTRSFGVDALLGLVPGIGGVAGLALAAVVITQGIAIGARGATVVRMLLNTAIDALISSIPVLGGPATALFKANERNVRLLSTHTLDPDRTRAESRRVLVIAGITIAATVVVVLIAAVALLVWLVTVLF